MKPLAICVCLSIVPIGLAAGVAGADGASRQSNDIERVLDIVSTELTEYPRADFESDRQVRCVAEGIVDRFGVERLEELGLDLDDGRAPRLYVPGLTDRERDRIVAAYGDCIHGARRFRERMVAEGMSAAEARCVSASYEASGIPRIHLTEAPHGESLVDTETARGHLDEFLNAAELACRDWL